MSQQTRRVILDGEYAGNYSARWFDDTRDDTAYLGTLWSSSIHSKPNNMTFDFQGSEILVVLRVFNRDFDGAAPQWGCTVDGIPTKIDFIRSPGWFSCSWNGDPSQSHRFLLAIETVEGNVAVDSLQFLPAFNSTRLENSVVVYPHDDPNVSIRAGNWTTLTHGGDNATLTDVVSSSLRFIFTGTGVIAQGWRATGFRAGKSIARYSLDGAQGVAFELLPPHPPSETIHDQKLFQLTELEPGILHTLDITYQGSDTPLVIDQFLVTDGNFRVEPEPEPARPTSSGSPSSSNASAKDGFIKILEIVLPVVGGLFLLALILGCCSGCFKCFNFGRRHGPQRREPSANDQTNDEPGQARPGLVSQGSNLIINGGTFNNVGRDQVNNHNLPPAHLPPGPNYHNGWEPVSHYNRGFQDHSTSNHQPTFLTYGNPTNLSLYNK